ncbi:MAG: PQQ-dependent catabolism-associated CXXCW motif protein [Rubrimonas sp.]
MRHRPIPRAPIPLAIAVACLLLCAPAGAEAPGPIGAPARSSAAAKARAPELFDPETGLRVARYRAPTPADAPGARTIGHEGLIAAVAAGAALLDVAPEGAGTWFGPPEGWIGARPRATIPGALWAPGVGRGPSDPEMEAYLDAALAHLAREGARPVVVFCFSDCWMSWNAAQRVARRLAPSGLETLWHPLGVDGWVEAGGRLATVLPFPPPP